MLHMKNKTEVSRTDASVVIRKLIAFRALAASWVSISFAHKSSGAEVASERPMLLCRCKRITHIFTIPVGTYNIITTDYIISKRLFK